MSEVSLALRINSWDRSPETSRRFSSGWLPRGRGEDVAERAAAGVKPRMLRAGRTSPTCSPQPQEVPIVISSPGRRVRQAGVNWESETDASWLGPPTPLLSRFLFPGGGGDFTLARGNWLYQPWLINGVMQSSLFTLKRRAQACRHWETFSDPNAAVLGFHALPGHCSSVNNTSLGIHYRKANTHVCFVEKL